MNYLVMLGSDMFYGTNGVLTVENNGKFSEFLRIREFHRNRSNGSFLTVDCDIKDKDNEREVKLFKNRPVAQDDNVNVSVSHTETIVKREDGSLIIRIDQIELHDTPLSEFEPLKHTLSGFPAATREHLEKQLKEITIDAVIKITGEFYAGRFHLNIKDEFSIIQGTKLSGNFSFGTGGIKLSNSGFML